MTETISIAGRSIGLSHRPFVIAEMSGNHNQSLDRALAIVEAAAKSGAHALKLQTYTADTMTLNLGEGEFFIDDPNSLWRGTSLHKLYQEAHTPWEWHAPIFERARSLGMIPFSDAVRCVSGGFSRAARRALLQDRVVREHGSAPHSQGSRDRQADDHLDRHGDRGRYRRGRSLREEAGCKDLVLLKCTSTYPAAAADTNLLTIPHMRALFGCEVGLSDHTFGIGAARCERCARRQRHREALHAFARRRRSRFDVLHGA